MAASLLQRRRSGLLLHPTSLSNTQGYGDLGSSAHAFLDFLVAAGQSYWQMLPLGPPGPGGSPYAARSAFAGNPALIAEERLASRDWSPSSTGCHTAADLDEFGQAKRYRLWELYCQQRKVDTGLDELLAQFARRHAGWLPDFALFMALHQEQGQVAWTAWPEALRRREEVALRDAAARLAEQVRFETWLQYQFDHDWQGLRSAAAARGIAIIGDMPIFVAHDSADVWAHQELFLLDEAGQPRVVAGVPPDYFSETGQRWGNPHYHWQRQAADGYRWWIERFRAGLATPDIWRIDHFRGFEAAWQIPALEETAINGWWVRAPGNELFAALRTALPNLTVIAEDLGVITPEVERMRRDLGLPGMKVLQFGFGGDADNPHLLHNHEHASVVYPGTHDNDTVAGWFATSDEAVRAHALGYLDCADSRIGWAMIRAAQQSVARTAITQVQDLLGLGSTARMNVPGKPAGNWTWRLRPGDLTPALATRLRRLTALNGRLAQKSDAG